VVSRISELTRAMGKFGVPKVPLSVIPSASSGQALRRSRRDCPELAVAPSEVEWVAQGIWSTKNPDVSGFTSLRGACPRAKRRVQNDSKAVTLGILAHFRHFPDNQLTTY